METQLMCLGVTYETAPVAERCLYALNKTQKTELTYQFRHELGLKGAVILTTCNRTEIYLESETTSIFAVRQLLISFLKKHHNQSMNPALFKLIHNTEDTAKHLLHLSMGLKSAVRGDKQIIAQLKRAYLEGLEMGSQGSLLERAFQAVFRSYKRVSVESSFRQGSTSVSHSSLKLIEKRQNRLGVIKPKLLIVGAGEIAEDVLRYLPKFSLGEVALSNRTEEKAQLLTKRYGIDTYPWSCVEQGDYKDFDVVITAVSNRKHLVNSSAKSDRYRLWVDLAMPLNIDPTISDSLNEVFNVDDISTQIAMVSELQNAALSEVNRIISEELKTFLNWQKEYEMRSLLRSYKHFVSQELAGKEGIENLTDRLVRGLAKRLRKQDKSETSELVIHFYKQQLKKLSA